MLDGKEAVLAAVGIVHATIDGRFIRFNDKFCDITGYAREELTGISFGDITVPDDIDVGNGPL
jgi:two-component system sensor histidine kinase UhpB